MTVHRFIGHSFLSVKASSIVAGSRYVTALGLILGSFFLHAAPALDFDTQVEAALATAEGAWAESLLDITQPGSAYDEQVFTELSPILDSPDAIKLPEDQLLTD